jgi:hypothetical protein
MKQDSKPVILALGLSLGLSLALLWLLAGSLPAYADPGTLYVATDGDDTKNCSTIANRCRTVQRAVEVATTGDEIRVSSGVYTDADTATLGYVVALNKTIALRGGYDGSFVNPPDPTANPTTLDAQRHGRVISITGDITPTIEGFIITGGDATGLGGILPGGQDAGGGIYCHLAHPAIADNVITDNIASSDTSVAGGGVYLSQCDRAILQGNTVVSNTASTGGYGRGGGLGLEYSAATLSSNAIMSNTASTGGTGNGGGLYLYLFGRNATLNNNVVVGNTGSTSGSGSGGGAYIQYGTVTLSSNIVRGNIARTPDSGSGGGFYIVYGDALTLQGNRIVDNAANSGGGMYVGQGSTFTLTNNIIAGNQAKSQGNELRVFGNIAYAPTSGVLLNNSIADTPGAGGAGLHIEGDSVALTMTNNVVAGYAVGITNTEPTSSTVTADHTLFHGNTTDYGAGVSSTDEVSGDPRFLSPATFNYHIGPHSAAIDAGIAIPWLTSDIDGDPRPLDAGYDIGADEARWLPVYLPLTMKNH